MRRVAEIAPAALLVGALVGLVPVVVTMMIYTLNTFGTRFDDTNRKIDDSVAALNTRIDDSVAALNTRIDDTNAHIVSLEATMEARFAAQDARITQLGRDIAQVSRDVAQVSRDVAQVSLDITQVLALLLAQNRTDPALSAGLAPAAP